MFKNISRVIPLAGALILALSISSGAHGPEGHSTGHKDAAAPHEETAMKAQHERMGAFNLTMQALLEAIVHGDRARMQDQVNHLSEALRGHEKDMPHKNISRRKEFQALYGELNRRIDRMAADAKAPDLSKAALSYGRLLETCSNCHRKFRD